MRRLPRHSGAGGDRTALFLVLVLAVGLLTGTALAGLALLMHAAQH